MITLGALAIAFGVIRIFVFKMPESPRYLLSKGRDAEAVEAVNYIARFNGKPETLTVSMLQDIDASLGLATTDADARQGLSRREIIRENLKDYKGVNYKSLFATRKFALHTSLTWLIWLTIGTSSLILIPTSFPIQTLTRQQASPTPSTSASSPPTSRPNSAPPPPSTPPTATTASSPPSASSAPSPPASSWRPRASAAAG